MLAGDVTVEVQGDDLVVTGDDNANLVFIEGAGAAGSYLISGVDGTDVFFNGQLQGSSLTVTGASGNIRVDLNGGDDALRISNVSVDELRIETNEGDDLVGLGALDGLIDLGLTADGAQDNGVSDAVDDLDGFVRVNDLLVIHTHGGNDVVAIGGLVGEADWDISLGDESDGTTNQTDDNPNNDFVPNVPLNDQLFIFIASGDNINVNAGTGDDLVNVNYLTAQGALIVDGGGGNDVISVNGSVFNDDVVLLGGSGNDTVAVDFSRQDGGSDAVLVLDSGGDDDFVLLARSLITESDVNIRTGGGSDRVVVGLYYANILGNLAIGGNVVGTLSIDTGGGNDTVDIRANVVTELFGAFGGGEDSVTVAFNHVTSDDTVGLDGGGGFDRLISGGNIFGEHVHIGGFEDLVNFLFGEGGVSPGIPESPAS
jgi:hypothetical protein